MKNYFVCLLLLAGFTGCASLTFKKDPEKTAGVKKVAIVAIASQQPATTQEKLLGAGGHGGMNGALCKTADHVKKMGQVLETALQKDLNLKVVPMAQVEQNSTYKKIAAISADKGVTQMLANGYTCFHTDGVIDSFKWNRLSDQEIRDMKDALKVDGLIRLIVEANEEGTSVMGISVDGSNTRVRLNVAMYNGVDEEPIYYDTYAEGEVVTEDKVTAFGFEDRSSITNRTLIGVQSASKKLTERYVKGNL